MANLDMKQVEKLRALMLQTLLAAMEDPDRVTTGWMQRAQAFIDSVDKLDIDPVLFTPEEEEELKKAIAQQKAKFTERNPNDADTQFRLAGS